MRRSSGNPLKHIIQVVLGGVAGILLAQIILWWIPADLSIDNRDLTGVGRKYGRFVPFLVPASIRNAGVHSELADSSDEKDSTVSPSKKRNGSAGARRAPAIPDFPFAESQLKQSPSAEIDELDRIADGPSLKQNEPAVPSPVEKPSGGNAGRYEFPRRPAAPSHRRHPARIRRLRASEGGIPANRWRSTSRASN